MKLPEFGKPLPSGEKGLILGKPTQQLFPLKYHWAWDYFRKAQANHWNPEDTPLGKDRVEYTNLSPEEKIMFDGCLAMLTTQDLVVIGNLEEAIEKHLTCPEATMYLARQGDEEAIHSWSYQWIVESLALEPESVYEKYLFQQSLYDKVVYSYQFHQRLLELRLGENGTTVGISEFLECLAFWTLGMEGGWFYNGFNFVYALRRTGRMQGSSEIFKYIQRDEAMHFNFWINVMNSVIAEYPDSFTPRVQKNIVSMVRRVVALEEAYAADICSNVLCINVIDYMSHFRSFMDKNLAKIGIEPVYPNDKPMAWVAEIVDLKEEKNFFEGVVKEYSKAGLTWDGTEDTLDILDKVTDWR